LLPPLATGGGLRREHFTEENLERFAAWMRSQGANVLSAEERDASLRAILAQATPGEDVFVFGYGSLMWNPAFHHVEARPAWLEGWHREFCLWNVFGRGTVENPGLMLALEPGDACHGLALRIAAADVASELGVLWKREMITGGYEARWVTLDAGGAELRAVTFVANRASSRYAGRLPHDVALRHLARARGPLGTSRAYVESLVEHLDALGLRDEAMRRIRRGLEEPRE
jgi:cation transport protein ChaC